MRHGLKRQKIGARRQDTQAVTGKKICSMKIGCLSWALSPLSIAASISQIPELKEQCPQLMLNHRT